MLLFIVLFAPACIATLLYERLRPGNRSVFRWIVMMICFAFFVNLLVYIADWFRGQTSIRWSVADNLSNVPFIIKYMGIALVWAILLPLILVRVVRVLDNRRLLSKNKAKNGK